jgi:hypothetical protein
MALIYASSSYQDLKEYRRRAAETIRSVGHVPVGIEHDGASQRRPLDECLADVRRCHAYVGIVGFRYGVDAIHRSVGLTRMLSLTRSTKFSRWMLRRSRSRLM